MQVREDVKVGHIVGSVGPSDRSSNDIQNMITNMDLDAGLHITYTLTSLTKDVIEGAFDMDRQTGSLVVARRLDREQQSEYRLEIRALDTTASNNPQSSAITVKVEIADVNDNPPKWEVDPLEIFVSESTAVGAIIYNFTATDADTGTNGELQYKLLRYSPAQLSTIDNKHDPDEIFSVDPLTGTLTLLMSLDYEIVNEYMLIVQALDQSSNTTERLQSTVTARILVEDVNDNSPIFVSPPTSTTSTGDTTSEGDSYLTNTITLSDATQVGQLVTHVVAIDKDSGNNGHITYAIVRGNEDGRFKIDAHAGFIELAKTLPPVMNLATASSTLSVEDFQNPSSSNQGQYHRQQPRQRSVFNGMSVDKRFPVVSPTADKINLVISASDHGTPQSREARLNLQILVQGTTSNPPRFSQSIYYGNISETIQSGSFVLQVSAKSFNGGNNGEFTILHNDILT